MLLVTTGSTGQDFQSDGSRSVVDGSGVTLGVPGSRVAGAAGVSSLGVTEATGVDVWTAGEADGVTTGLAVGEQPASNIASKRVIEPFCMQPSIVLNGEFNEIIAVEDQVFPKTKYPNQITVNTQGL